MEGNIENTTFITIKHRIGTAFYTGVTTHMRLANIFAILLLISTYSNSQGLRTGTAFDSVKHQRIYQISRSDFQQIELIENLDGTFQETLTNIIWNVNKKEERTKPIEQTLNVPSDHVEQLMNIGFTNNIETNPNCQDVEGYVTGVDGTSISFGIRTPELERTYYYLEPENDNYQDSTVSETRKVRTIIMSIHERMNLKLLFDTFTSELPSGKYAFGGIIMEK
ncbi:MAG: hypothetical protein AB8B73_03435 [Ekhidna sp.]